MVSGYVNFVVIIMVCMDCMKDGGLNRFNLEYKEFFFFAPSAGFTNIHGLCLVDDKLWVGKHSLKG